MADLMQRKKVIVVVIICIVLFGLIITVKDLPTYMFVNRMDNILEADTASIMNNKDEIYVLNDEELAVVKNELRGTVLVPTSMSKDYIDWVGNLEFVHDGRKLKLEIMTKNQRAYLLKLKGTYFRLDDGLREFLLDKEIIN